MSVGIFPEEVVSDVPRITITGGGRVQVEQHRGLAAYLPEEIVFRCASGRIRIVGSGLHIDRYSAQEAVVTGRIADIHVEDGGRQR